jgi:parallel beta-helix repeat protein
MSLFKNKISRKLLLATFILTLAIFTISQTNSNPENYNQEDSFTKTENLKNPLVSDFWNEEQVNFIHIKNDNWSATDFDWIQNKTGAWNDPHIIENITINAGKFGIGILIEDSSEYFIINNCTIYNSSTGQLNTAGIYLKNTSNGTIIDNNLSYNNGSGLILDNSINNTISNNYITNNGEDGIFVIGQSRNNTLYENDIVNNTIKGLDLNKTTSWNIIYRNNFTNNGINAMDNGTSNHWDNGQTGNYWDDYLKCDADRDNIGDWPYDIPGQAGAQDEYPICYKACVFARREAKDEIEDEDEEIIAVANEFVEFLLDNIGLYATWAIFFEIITGIVIIVNKKRKSKISEERFW